jgi:hypothetical protein
MYGCCSVVIRSPSTIYIRSPVEAEDVEELSIKKIVKETGHEMETQIFAGKG